MGNSVEFDKITLGVCYYPEHWDKSMWRDDLQRMKECGIEIIRIAEFAWNLIEPEDGVFTFDFWDEFMTLVAEEKMKVIFCTPTATPPQWLSKKYPEILNADIDGNTIYPGLRRQHNLNSKIYRDYSARITDKLAEHYVNNANVIGWQLDNEINCEVDRYYSESDHESFRKYCKNKFGTLEAFNKAMGTIVWNQTYTSWDEVYLTRRTNFPGNANPHLQLEEARFISDTVISYFKLQADIIRKWQKYYAVEKQFITSNGLFNLVDYHRLVDEVLDFYCYDNYPAFAFEYCLKPEETNGFKDRNTSFVLTRLRSISPNYGIMEQQSGAGGWNCRMKMPMPKPGQMRLWTMQAIAHGADFVSYFRWRTARFGTEIYWHGLLDYDNRENRRIAELKSIRDDISKMKEVAGTKVTKQVGLVVDYDNEWDGMHDIWHGPLDRISYDGWFRCLEEKHIPFDLIYLNDKTTADEIADYSLLVYPHASIFNKTRYSVLKEYVESGGKLIIGARSGYKDMRGQCIDIPMPGLIADLCGCYVKDYTAESIFDETVKISIDGKTAETKEFFDLLEITDGEAVGEFVGEFEKELAIVKKKNKSGICYYVGGAFTKELADLLMDEVGENPTIPFDELDKKLELVTRKKEDKEFFFILNYDKAANQINIKEEMVNILTGEKVKGNIEIGGYDCLILKK